MSNVANTNDNVPASDAPVAWFVSPNGPNNAPKPELESYIYQVGGEQKGSGPVGTAWVPTNPSTNESASTTTERSKLDNLFPSQKPAAPVFHSKED
ncbi:unnamed protein product [Rhizoctonia solani]|uniref:Uncharacterized protein n=1 Tax=Rhizoctonia solani TaxID=456999 RepID=A0A8H3GG19_9AGAM|nr:unnamed protein product [Rhizoctonia solani]